MGKINNKALLFLTGILFLQIILSIWVCNRNPLHGVDEALSYTFAAREGCYGPESEMNKWFSSEEYLNRVFAVPEDERFDFSIPYRNSLDDIHPPLYCLLLFLINSVYYGHFTWWTAISVNIFCMVLTSIFLFLLSRRLLQNDYCALMPVLMWNLTGALYAVRYIRMNAVLTTFSVALLWYMMYLLQEGVTIKRLLPLLLIAYLGFISQILFTVFSFIATLAAVLYLFLKKNWKQGFMLGFTMLLSLMLFFVTWPSFFHLIINNNPYNSPAPDISYPATPMGRLQFIRKYLEVSLSQAFVHNRFLVMILLPILFLALCFFLWKRKAYENDDERKAVVFFLFFIPIFTLIFIGNSLIAPDQPCQYYHLYPLFSLVFGGLILFFLRSLPLDTRRFNCFYIVIMCLFAVTSFDQYRVSEMSKDKREVYTNIEDKTDTIEYALHIAEDGGVQYHDVMGMYILQHHDSIYNTDKNGLEDLGVIMNGTVSNGKVAVYIQDLPVSSEKDQVYYMSEVTNVIENSGVFSEVDVIGRFEDNTILVCRK